MEIGGGTNVQINFRDANLCMLVTFPWLVHLYLAFSGDGWALFYLCFHGFNLFYRILWRIKCNLFIYWKSVLYYINFEVINNGFGQIISCTHGGFAVYHHCTGRHPFSVFLSQLFKVLFYHSSGLVVCNLCGFCYHFGVVLPSFR